MNPRRWIVALLVVCLCTVPLCALFGVLVADQHAWELIGMSLILTVTAGVWFIIVRRGTGALTGLQWVQLVGTGLASSMFIAGICGQILTWGLRSARLPLTGMVLLLMLAPVSAAMLALREPRLRLSGKGALWLLSGAVLLFVMAIWLNVLDEEMTVCGFLLLFGAPVLAACLVGPESDASLEVQQGARGVRWLGGVLTCCAILVLVVAVVGLAPRPRSMRNTMIEWTVGLGVTLSTMAVMTGLLNLALMAQGPAWARWLHQMTILTVGMLGACVAVIVVQGLEAGYNGMLERMSMVLAVGSAALVILSIIIDRMARARRVRFMADLASVRLTCPYCGRKQHVALGGGACQECGLGIVVTLQQNTCFVCGYALHGIRDATTCPECGCALHGTSGQALPPGVQPGVQGAASAPLTAITAAGSSPP